MPHSAPPPPAEIAALKGLAYLADSPEALGRFLLQSGMAADSLRARAADPDFLAAVMDFLLADDDLLTGFCAAESLDPKTVHLLRRDLPGG